MASLEHIRLRRHLNSFLYNCSAFLKNLPKQRVLLSSNLFADSSFNIFHSRPLKYRMLIFFSYLARFETDKWLFQSHWKILCQCWNDGMAVFIILVCAADLTAVDTSVLLLMQHQKIKLAMIYIFSQFLEFFEIKTKCCSFIVPKRQNGVLIFLKLYFRGIFHEY